MTEVFPEPRGDAAVFGAMPTRRAGGDIDALIAEARRHAEWIDGSTLMRELADALELTRASLCKAEWQFRDADEANADNMAVGWEAQADLARAREVIEKVRNAINDHGLTDNSCVVVIEFAVHEYDQKVKP